MNAKETQNQMILSYLKTGKKLTKLSALKLFKCWSLSSRISDIRKMGFLIDSPLIKLKSGKHVAEYSIT